MTGMPIRNANRAALSRVRPRNRPAAMVTPDRLVPGNRASAWAAPMVTASPSVQPVQVPRRDAPYRSAAHSSRAPRTMITGMR